MFLPFFRTWLLVDCALGADLIAAREMWKRGTGTVFGEDMEVRVNKKGFVSCSWGSHSPSVLPHHPSGWVRALEAHLHAGEAQQAQTVPRTDCATCCAQARGLADVTQPGIFCIRWDARLFVIPFLPLLSPSNKTF